MQAFEDKRQTLEIRKLTQELEIQVETLKRDKQMLESSNSKFKE